MTRFAGQTLTGAALVQPRLMDSTPLYLPLVTKPFMDTGETTRRISLSSDAAQGNGASTGPTISDDGRYVAFFSRANNLVADDTNSVSDMFVHDRQTDETTRVSVASDGSEANAATIRGVISRDGRYVVFASEASNLVSDDTNGVALYRYDAASEYSR